MIRRARLEAEDIFPNASTFAANPDSYAQLTSTQFAAMESFPFAVQHVFVL